MVTITHQFPHSKHLPTAPIRYANTTRTSRREAAPPPAKAPPPAPNPRAPSPPPPPPPAPEAHARRSRPEIASLKPPKPFVPPSAKFGKPARPSLSEQLAAIREQGSSLLHEIQKTFNVDGPAGVGRPLCTLAPRSVRVGTKTCDWPGVLKFYEDRAEYHFVHPKHRHVEMLMRYRDMSQLGLARGSAQLRFRIEHSLEWFTEEYNHFDPTHHLDVTLASAAEVDALTGSAAWPRMQALCRSRR
ncbi:hypothetical protein T492DRAFT_1145726 [Pavlovales sp. CCMP2436]|nr:hypothetical protein T492DRAFT_1145726 [Pavlovales sp. CCMP2436]